MNQIVTLKTVELNGPAGPAVGIMVTLSGDTPAGAGPFAAEVLERFKVHRMAAPPETSLLLVTIVGPLDAETFAMHWRRHASDDPAARAFLSRMRVADVIQGDTAGRQLSKASLLIPATPPEKKPWWKVW